MRTDRILHLLKFTLLLLLLKFIVIDVKGATIILINDKPTLPVDIGLRENINRIDCTFIISGDIKTGDSEIINDIILDLFELNRELYFPGIDMNPVSHLFVACLDSRGGSFNEALKIADLFVRNGVATYVPNRSYCESACALVFLAGSIFTTVSYRDREYMSTRRILHENSILGFHAPFLFDGQGLDDENSLENRVRSAERFDQGIRTIAELLDMSDRLTAILDETGPWLPDSIFRMIVTTPPSQMTYVKTTSDALNLKALVVPMKSVDYCDLACVSNICENAFELLIPIYYDRRGIDYEHSFYVEIDGNIKNFDDWNAYAETGRKVGFIRPSDWNTVNVTFGYPDVTGASPRPWTQCDLEVHKNDIRATITEFGTVELPWLASSAPSDVLFNAN